MVKLTSETLEDYPNFSRWVREELPKVEQRSPQVWNAFLRFAQMNASGARDVLSGGLFAPELSIENLGASLGRFRPNDPGKIVLATDIARRFQETPNEPKLHALAEATILHELVHWGDYLTGAFNSGHGVNEYGDAFERAAYGKVHDRYWLGDRDLDTLLNEAPQPAPQSFRNVPFAPVTAAATFFPVDSRHARSKEIAYRDENGRIHGREGRRFGADRKTIIEETGEVRLRYHCVVDLFAYADDVIHSCESGEIVSIYRFYGGTFALIVMNDIGTVINYGEVKKNSWLEFEVKIGSRVNAGQRIARVGVLPRGGSMLHFETYRAGTTQNSSWFQDQLVPDSLLDPTRYLLFLSEHGQ